MTATMQRKKTPRGYIMDEVHKKALAEGREISRIVRDYLVTLEEHRPRRGRKRDIGSTERRLAEIDAKVKAEDNTLRKLNLIAEKEGLEADLERRQGETSGYRDTEDRFVEVAAEYGRRKGISYSAWRQVGVPASVLTEAGISRTN